MKHRPPPLEQQTLPKHIIVSTQIHFLYVDVLFLSWFLCHYSHLFHETFDLAVEAVQLALLGRITLAPGQRLLETPT